jgi:hypothetical protein
VALDSRGNIFVCERGNGRVQMLDRRGRHVAVFDGSATPGAALARPTAIAVVDRNEPWSFHKADRVVVVDKGGRRLQSFTPAGARLAAFEDTTVAGVSFAHVALDYYDNVYATDTRRSQIHKLDARLRLVTSFGRRGRGDAEFDAPTGIAIWRRFGQVFVAEGHGAQYYWIGVDMLDTVARPRRAGTGESVRVTYQLTERAMVDARVVDAKGALVAQIASGARQEMGAQSLVWSGRDAQGVAVRPGSYAFEMTATATYSSRKHFQRARRLPIEVIAEPPGAPTPR